MQGKAIGAWLKTKRWLKDQRGQNTVEYIMMLAIVALVIGGVGVLLQKFMPELFTSVKEKILGTVGGMGGG